MSNESNGNELTKCELSSIKVTVEDENSQGPSESLPDPPIYDVPVVGSRSALLPGVDGSCRSQNEHSGAPGSHRLTGCFANSDSSDISRVIDLLSTRFDSLDRNVKKMSRCIEKIKRAEGETTNWLQNMGEFSFRLFYCLGFAIVILLVVVITQVSILLAR